MGRPARTPAEEQRLVKNVLAAVNAYGRDVRISFHDGETRIGRSYSMGIRNTNWSQPLQGYIEFTDARGVTIELDPLDIHDVAYAEERPSPALWRER